MLVALLGVWAASRTVRVSDAAVFTPAPLVGFVRVDIAVPVLLIQAAAVLRLPAPVLACTAAIGLFGPHLVPPPVAWNKPLLLYGVAAANGASVTVHEAVLSRAARADPGS